MGTIRRRGANYFYISTDAAGRRVERKECPDKRATEEMLPEAESDAARA